MSEQSHATCSTQTIEETDGSQQTNTSDSTPTLQLRLEQPRDDRRVVFHDGVIDNEHMNRMKSKCKSENLIFFLILITFTTHGYLGCCIYRKPLAFGESSSSEDDECEHCFGHPEKRKKKKKPTDSDKPSTSNDGQSQPKEDQSVEEPASSVDFEAEVSPSL